MHSLLDARSTPVLSRPRLRLCPSGETAFPLFASLTLAGTAIGSGSGFWHGICNGMQRKETEKMRWMSFLLLALLVPVGTTESQGRTRNRVRVHVRPETRTTLQRVARRLPGRLSRLHGRHGSTHRRGHGRKRRVHVRVGRRHGHWKTVQVRVWVPAVYEWRVGICGIRYRVLVSRGHYEYVCRRIWCPA